MTWVVQAKEGAAEMPAVDGEERTCGTCARWQPGKTDERMRDRGFAVCALGPRWRFLPPHQTCEQWRVASSKALNARKVGGLIGETRREG